jgi:FeS assembly SUF system protein
MEDVPTPPTDSQTDKAPESVPAERGPETYATGDLNPELSDKLVEVLKSVYDPEIPVNIYEMGMIYEVRADTEGSAYVKMTLTSPSCPVAGTLPGEVEAKVRTSEGVTEAKVELVWEPTWTMEMISDAARLELNL